MAWRLAKSLSMLRIEISESAPNRSRLSDGTIGDPAHASRASRHNPNRYGVVTALDITHDPKGGVDIHAIACRAAANPHPELAYIISNGQVAKRKTGFRWERYYGSNPHDAHAHFAVGVGPDSDPLPPYDSTIAWNVATPVPEEDDMAMTPEDRQALIDDIAAAVQHKLVVEDTRWIDWRFIDQHRKIIDTVHTARNGLAKLVRTIPGASQD
jgi:hypothetical protein